MEGKFKASSKKTLLSNPSEQLPRAIASVLPCQDSPMLTCRLNHCQETFGPGTARNHEQAWFVRAKKEAWAMEDNKIYPLGQGSKAMLIF